jgi:dihydropteroate synthase
MGTGSKSAGADFRNTIKNYHIMGVLNITPDSFSDGGKFTEPEAALEHCKLLIDDGADSIDIGGMASGPGSVFIDESLECERVYRVCSLLAEHRISRRVALSVDTFRSKVAQEAHRLCGVSIINDISAMRHDPEMAPFIAGENLSVVMMYSGETPEYPLVSGTHTNTGPLLERIKRFFDERINYALRHNIPQGRIILDPGMGAFLGDSGELSWELINGMSALTTLFKDFLFMSGVSRKSFINCTSAHRDPCSKLLELYLIEQGVHFIRTHNVAMLCEMIQVKNRISRLV